MVNKSNHVKQFIEKLMNRQRKKKKSNSVDSSNKLLLMILEEGCLLSTSLSPTLLIQKRVAFM